MRLLFYSFFLLLSTTSIVAQKPTISLTIKGYNVGESVKIIGFYGDQNYLLDTARFDANGVAVFNQTMTPNVAYPIGFYYMTLPDKGNFQFFISDTTTSLAFKAEKGNILNTLQHDGSSENDLLYKNLRFQAQLDPKTGKKALMEHLDTFKKTYPTAFFTRFKLAGQNPAIPENITDNAEQLQFFRANYWNEVNFSDPRLLRTPVLGNKLKTYIKELTTQQPDSLMASVDILVEKILQQKDYNKDIFQFILNWITLQYKPTQTALMDGEAVYSHLILKYFTPELAFWSSPEELVGLRKEATAMQPSLIGKIGQDVWGKDKNGNVRHLYDTKEAKYTVLFIYNPECEHCQEQAPLLRTFYDQYRAKGVAVFALAANNGGDAKWRSFQEKYGVNWIDVVDPLLESRYHEKYTIDITPEIYVLDAEHRIIAKNIKPTQIAEVLKF